MPPEGGIAREIASRLRNRAVSRRIKFEQPLRVESIAPANAFDVCIACGGRRKAHTFVGVVSDEDGHFVILSVFVQLELIVGNHVSIDDRPARRALGHSEHFVRWKLPQLLGVVYTYLGSPVLTRPFRFGQRMQILTRTSVGAVNRAERTSALRYRCLKQALGER